MKQLSVFNIIDDVKFKKIATLQITEKVSGFEFKMLEENLRLESMLNILSSGEANKNRSEIDIGDGLIDDDDDTIDTSIKPVLNRVSSIKAWLGGEGFMLQSG